MTTLLLTFWMQQYDLIMFSSDQFANDRVGYTYTVCSFPRGLVEDNERLPQMYIANYKWGGAYVTISIPLSSSIIAIAIVYLH